MIPGGSVLVTGRSKRRGLPPVRSSRGALPLAVCKKLHTPFPAAEKKPVALAALLRRLGPQQTIIFTSSVEATHRLWLMLRTCAGLPGKAVEYSSLLRPEERRASLEAFRSGYAQVGPAATGEYGAGPSQHCCGHFSVLPFTPFQPCTRRCYHFQSFCSSPCPPPKLLVCSDAMTRGMDVTGVACVINYDAPV